MSSKDIYHDCYASSIHVKHIDLTYLSFFTLIDVFLDSKLSGKWQAPYYQNIYQVDYQNEPGKVLYIFVISN